MVSKSNLVINYAHQFMKLSINVMGNSTVTRITFWSFHDTEFNI